jgi:hypothetical protein
MEWSAQLERSGGPGLQDLRGGVGLLVPGHAFSPGTRAVSVGGGSPLVGQKVRQLPGILGWSSVIKSGAQLLGPLSDSDVGAYHDTSLPSVQWLPESRLDHPADINFAATVMKPKRISGPAIVSRRLLMQSTGAIPLDDFSASRLKSVFASRLDQAALYGRGSAQNEPTGVLTATDSQSVTVGNPPIWADLAQMHYLSTDYDADRDSFGWITNPRGRKYFESTARFATGSSASLWDLMQREAEVSLEVTDDRLSAGCGIIW